MGGTGGYALTVATRYFRPRIYAPHTRGGLYLFLVLLALRCYPATRASPLDGLRTPIGDMMI